MALVPKIVKDDWVGLRRVLQKLASSKLGPTSSPTFAGLVLSDLTASRLIATDAGKGLASADLASWVAGTENEISVADDGNGSVTVALANIVDLGGSI